MNDDEPRIFMRHARALNLCAKGTRLQAQRMGISVTDFCANGYPCSLAEKSGNPYLIAAARLAREEWERTHGKG